MAAPIRATEEEVKLLARLMRAEAEEDGELGMLLVGNVGVNRVIAECLDFTEIDTIKKMVFQSPGGFEAVRYSYFYHRPRERERRLARQVINGNKYWPGSYALWFYAPTDACAPTFFNQSLEGRYKSHCFYVPSPQDCPSVYR